MNVKSRITCFIVLMLCINITIAENKKFKVYDATQYKNKPDLSIYGIKDITVVYGHFLWPNRKVNQDIPKKSFLSDRLKDYPKDNGAELLCLDIEHWNVSKGRNEAAESIGKYLDVLKTTREVFPNRQIGYYGVPPVRDYFASISQESSSKNKKWVEVNLRLKELGESVDVIFPSLYTFYNKPEEWALYAKGQIKQAKQYGKPVIVFLWPQYHESNFFSKWDYIDADFWRLQLETSAKYADGVVIWGGWDFKNKGPALWDEDAEWWKETQVFINILNEKRLLSK